MSQAEEDALIEKYKAISKTSSNNSTAISIGLAKLYTPQCAVVQRNRDAKETATTTTCKLL